MQARSLVIQAERGDEPASLDLVRRYLAELHDRLGMTACESDVDVEAAAYRPPSGSSSW